MGQKIKPRQQRKPRSLITRDMLVTRKGGPHTPKDEKRARNTKNTWEKDWED